jgi:hypothetical protein
MNDVYERSEKSKLTMEWMLMAAIDEVKWFYFIIP